MRARLAPLSHDVATILCECVSESLWSSLDKLVGTTWFFGGGFFSRSFCLLIWSGVSRQQLHMRSTYVLSLVVLFVQARGMRCTSVVSHTTTSSTSSIVFFHWISSSVGNCWGKKLPNIWVRQVFCLTCTHLLLKAASHCCMYSCVSGRVRICRPLYCAPL